MSEAGTSGAIRQPVGVALIEPDGSERWRCIFETRCPLPASVELAIAPAADDWSELLIPLALKSSAGEWSPILLIRFARPVELVGTVELRISVAFDEAGNPVADLLWRENRFAGELVLPVPAGARTNVRAFHGADARSSGATEATQHVAITLPVADVLAILGRTPPDVAAAARAGELSAWAAVNAPDAVDAMRLAERLYAVDATRGARAARWLLGERTFVELPPVADAASVIAFAPANWQLFLQSHATRGLSDWVRFALRQPDAARDLELAKTQDVPRALHRLLWANGWRGVRIGETVVSEPSPQPCTEVPEAEWAAAVASGLVRMWLTNAGIDASAFLESVAARRATVASRPTPEDDPLFPDATEPGTRPAVHTAASSVVPAAAITASTPPLTQSPVPSPPPRADAVAAPLAPAPTTGLRAGAWVAIAIVVVAIIAAAALSLALVLLWHPNTGGEAASDAMAGDADAVTGAVWKGTLGGLPAGLRFAAEPSGGAAVAGTLTVERPAGISTTDLTGSWDAATGHLALSEREGQSTGQAGVLAADWRADGTATGTWTRRGKVDPVVLAGPYPTSQ